MQAPPPQASRTSALYHLRDIDEPDDIETQWKENHKTLEELTGPLASEREVSAVLLAKVSDSMEKHAELTCALIFGILTDGSKAPQLIINLTATFRSVREYDHVIFFVVRDGFAYFISQLSRFVTEKYPKTLESVRAQVLWLLSELMRMNIHDTDTLAALLIRHVLGGDVGARNLLLLQQVMSLLIEQRMWLLAHPVLIPTVVFTFLRLIPDHTKSQFAELKEKEVAFTVGLLKERLADCKSMGRDLIRLLIDVARIPEFEALLRDLLTRPQSLGLTIGAHTLLLSTRTPRKFLQGRITPEMETQILFLLGKVKMSSQKRYQKWFAARWLATAESDSLIVDIVRYVVCVYHPPNHILSSDVVPRWAFIGWLLRCIRAVHFAANAKLALFLDWLYFDIKTESLMNLEPALLLMAHSAAKSPPATASLLEFLTLQVEHFDPAHKDAITASVRGSFHILLEKGVLPSLEPILMCSAIDPLLRAKLRKLLPSLYEDLDARVSVFSEVKQHPSAQPSAQLVTPPRELPRRRSLDEPLPPRVGDLTDQESDAAINPSEDIDMGDAGAEVSPSKYRKTQETVSSDQVAPDLSDAKADDVQSEVAPISDPAPCAEIGKKLIAAISRDDFAAASTQVDLLRPAFLAQTPVPVSDAALTALEGLAKFNAPLIRRALRALPVFAARALRYSSEDPSRQVYATLLDDSEMPIAQQLYQDCKTLHTSDSAAFLSLVPYIFRSLSKAASGNLDLITLVVSSLDPANLYSLCSSLMLHRFSVFGEHVAPVVAASLSWEAFEQYSLWQILRAEMGGRSDLVDKFAPVFLAQIDPETLTALLLLLRDLPPSVSLLSALLNLSVSFSNFVTALLSHWAHTAGATLLSRLVELSYSDDASALDFALAQAHVQQWRKSAAPADVLNNKLFAKFLAHISGKK